TVVVRIGTAVFVFEAVLVLGLVGALIGSVGDAVVVVVALGAAIVVLEAVFVLGLVRTFVIDVGGAVAVIVRLGATILVLVAIFIFGLVRAGVERVWDTVAIAIVPTRRRDAFELRHPRDAGRDPEFVAARADLAGADHQARRHVGRNPQHHA